MIKAIVLDIGGVILRTEDHTGRKALEKKYGLQPGGAEKLVFNSDAALASTIGLAKSDAIWHHVSKQLELSHEALEDFVQAFWRGDRADRELLQFIMDCRADYKTALLSNAWENARNIFEKEYGIIEGETVDLILISSELGVAKPEDRMYYLLAEKLECKFYEILFVDDFFENVHAAESLGIKTIHYKPGMNMINEIKSRLSPG